ncbi:MAG: NAD/NADP octopine/nopaline dehydrogenase family protein [Rhizobiales bacterium]|nr:NAD/NADP octopine/nopaline dehydrogenase family protein [Hyphomicrobiales bacterium]
MKIAVLGGGHGCYAAAADLAEQGHDVAFWRRDKASLAGIMRTGEIILKDASGTRAVKLGLVTDDLSAAVSSVALVVIPLPATAQADLAETLAPHLEDGQVVFIPPGTFGSLIFARAMKKAGNDAAVSFAETGTLPYLARKHGEDNVTISVRATRLPTGIFPASRTDQAFAILEQAYPAVERLDDCLSGALMNAGPIIHPPLIMMNAGPLEHFDAWDIHNEGTQPSIRSVTDALDAERVALREALGYGAPHFPLADYYDDARPEWMYGNASHERLTDSGDWREKIDLHTHRYLREDIALGLVFYVTLGRWANVDMPVASGLVALASAVTGDDLINGPRSWQGLGLDGMSHEDVTKLLHDGKI